MVTQTSYKKHFLVSLATIFVVGALISVFLYALLIYIEKQNLYGDYKERADAELAKTDAFIIHTIDHIKQTLDALALSSDFQIFSESDFDDKQAFAQDMHLSIEANHALFQLRFIDKNGQEIIRFDRDNQGRIFEVNDLQDKKNRYYFTKTKELKKDTYYVSNIDLNVEHGKVEKPYKPTIRVAKPIFKNSRFDGMLIANYNATNLIKTIQNNAQFNVYLIDEKGNFLLHPKPEKCWSTQLGQNYKASDEIDDLESLLSGSLENTNKTYYTKKITLTDNDFYVLYSLKPAYYDKAMDNIHQNIIMVFSIVALIGLPFAIIASYIQSSQARLLEYIFDNIPHPMFLKNKKGFFVLANNAMAELYSFKNKREILGKDSYKIIDQDIATQYMRRDSHVLEQGSLKIDEIFAKKDTDETVYFETIMVKITYFGIFKRTYILGIYIDITELKRLNETLALEVEREIAARIDIIKEKDLQDKLLTQQAKMAAMGDMMQAIIHQWKQPLNVISLSVTSLYDIAKEDTRYAEELNKSADTILDQIDFMNQTINDFRNFFAPKKEVMLFQPCKIITKIKSMFQGVFEKQNIIIITQNCKQVDIAGSPHEFMQVILNLFTNTRDALQEKGMESGQIICDYAIDQNGKALLIYIRDNAGGIPKHLLPKRLFEPNITTKETGTGIGLYIAKHIVERHINGKISVHNIKDGAEFIIELPIANL